MGYGDDLIITSHASEIKKQFPDRQIVIGSVLKKQAYHSIMYDNNPNISDCNNLDLKKPIHIIDYHPGNRPYIDYKNSTNTKYIWNKNFKVTPGEIYFSEQETNEANKIIHNINTLGGAVSAIEKEYQQNEIATSAYEYQKGIDNQSNIIVGVNKFKNQIEENNNHILHLSEKAAANQINRLKEFKKTRNIENVNRELQKLHEASKQNTNLMPYIIKAVKSSATLGEISDILRKSFGIHS